VSVALVLPAEAVSSSSPTTFPGFPGVWPPGEPIEAQVFVDAGLFADPDEMVSFASELGLPLETTTVKKGSAPLPERPNHVSEEPEPPPEEEPEPTSEEIES
jgi:hypothetical protein